MGEFELLRKVRERLGADGDRVVVGSGDDAAVTVPGGATATSVDAVVDGVHFRREHYESLDGIGCKALAAALSDLAAMGAEAGEAYVVVGAPADLGEAALLELVDGVVALAGETGTTLAGGDLTSSPVLFVSITVVGHAGSPGELVGRAGARPGDILVVSGELGAAAAGLLLAEGRADQLSSAERAGLLARQLRPSPRLRAGRALAAAGARAMIDISDGLGGDAVHLSEASGVGLRIDAEALPLAVGVVEVATAAGRDPLELAVSGGEDYELLAALPPSTAAADIDQLSREADAPITIVGEAVDEAGVEIRRPEGPPLDPSGFEQLR